MSTLVIIPTYNEQENIVPLVNQILELPADLEILVIDDNSPDGTSGAVLETFSANRRVHLLKRERKLGLGTAYTAGFNHAITNKFDSAITMDADFSHNPRHIPELIKASIDSDLVIGSRYVSGGATVNWGLIRIMISRIANLMAHHFLRLQPSDCTSGFRLYQSRSLQLLEFESVIAEGYSYLVEILHRAAGRNLKIVEVPITFEERRRGKSKISRKEVFKAIQTMIRLRLRPEEKQNRVVIQV
jgi:dolichol-phosphate mannosyltransferase